jgi:hypothetical protein
VKGVRESAKRVAGRATDALPSKVLLVIGYLTLVSALLGAAVLYRTWRGSLLR